MAVDLHPGDGEAGATVARAAGPWHEGSRWELPPPLVRLVRAGWPALWILLFAFHHWHAALVVLFLTRPVMVAVRGTRRERRHRRRVERDRDRWRALQHAAATPSPPRPAASWTSAAERALAAAVVRAETSGGRLDADALALVREADQLLRPLLAHVRTRGADAQVRHDLEAIATAFLPEALEAHLVLPADRVHERRAPGGTSPADELRSQLTLLVEGCRQLRDAVLDADVARQQELSRFLDARFRRSDLEL